MAEALERELRALLRADAVVGRTLCWLDTVGSTNDYLKDESFGDGAVALAERQTAGKGRRGRSFESPEGRGLYLSVLLRPDLPPERLLPLTGMCAVAAADAVEQAAGVRPAIKWTNDLVLNGRKLAGILVEPLLRAGETPRVIIGVGVNVLHRPEDFGSEVGKLATSLYQETGREISRVALAAALLAALDKLYAALRAGDVGAYVARYRKDCLTLGREVQLLWGDVTERVTALDIDDDFGLLVRRADGREEIVRTGEVSVRGLYGYVE